MSYGFWDNRVKRLSEFDSKFKNYKFAVMVEDTISYMGADYGPPDPPPQMEYETVIRIYAFKDEDEVLGWIKNHTDPRYRRPAPFKIFKVEGVSVTTEIKMTLG